MKFKNPYWNHTTRLEMLSQWIIIHSILYYMLDTSIVPDIMFDNNAAQFKMLYKEKKSHFKYAYVMHDFNGKSGYDLYSKLNEKDKTRLLLIAYRLKERFE